MLKMLTTKIKMMALCIALLVTGTALLAQSTTQGAIGGTVFDSTFFFKQKTAYEIGQ